MLNFYNVYKLSFAFLCFFPIHYSTLMLAMNLAAPTLCGEEAGGGVQLVEDGSELLEGSV